MSTKHAKNEVFEMILNSDTDDVVSASVRSDEKGNFCEWQAGEVEGQLAVDVIQNAKDIVIISTIAGADPGSIEVYIYNDLLTIRGVRSQPVRAEKDLEYLHQECFWGRFSRTIVLPVEVKGFQAKARYNNGVLTIRIPKLQNSPKIQIRVVEE